MSMNLDVDQVTETYAANYGAQLRSLLAAAAMRRNQRTRRVIQAVTDHDVSVSLIASVDEGAHASGWWRNSEYDRCLHLSMCGLTAGGTAYADIPELDRRAVARVFFGSDIDKTWLEPPASRLDPYRNVAASSHTWHLRLFLDQHDNPIQPNGEVYTLQPWADGTSPEKVFRS